MNMIPSNWISHGNNRCSGKFCSFEIRKACVKAKPVCAFFPVEVVVNSCAYLESNISIIVKREASPIEKIRAIIKDQNGALMTSDLLKHGIPRTYLSILEKKGEVQRISIGVYSATGYMLDEMVAIQSR